jgi:hypothetical protein
MPVLLWPLILASLGLLGVALWLLLISLALTWFGVTVQGTVTGVVPARSGSGNGAQIQYQYYVGTREHSGADNVAPSALGRLGVGAKIKVRVLSSLPGQARLEEPPGLSGGPPYCLLALALLCSSAVGILLRPWVRRARGQRYLVQHGVATAGWIIHREEAGRRVRYRYRAPRHGMGSGEETATADMEWQVTVPLRPDDFAAAQVGERETVLYDPREPSRSLLYCFADYAALVPDGPAPRPAG